MKVAVLVVNWNSGPLLGQCLDHLDRQTRPPDRIIVIDNASTDGSIDRATPRPGVQVVRLPENAGFAAANNRAAELAADCDLLALLNPDAFPDPRWLAALVDAARDHPESGSFGCRMLRDADPASLDGIGDVYHVGGMHWRQGHGSPAAATSEDPSDIFSACAAAALYRQRAFVEAGAFDESYFCYSEDVDLGFRLQLLGYSCRYVPAAVVRHVGSALSGTRSEFSIYHGHRNMVWTWVKNMPGALFWLYLPQHLLANLAALIWFSWRGNGLVVFRAKRDALRGFARAWRQRRAIQRGRRTALPALLAKMSRGLLTPFTSRQDRFL